MDPEPWLARLGPKASENRQARAARFHFRMDALRCLAAEALLRHALGRQHQVPAAQCRLATGAEGKPYLLDHPDLHFNLSHSGPWVLCALHGAPVGIDVEAVPDQDLLPAPSILAPEELQLLAHLAPRDARDFFYRVWTLKESLLKALGTGLSLDPGTIALHFEADDIKATHPSRALAKLHLLELPMPEGAKAALCYE